MTSIILELLVYNEIPHDIDNLFVTLKLNRALMFIDYEFIDIENCYHMKSTTRNIITH